MPLSCSRIIKYIRKGEQGDDAVVYTMSCSPDVLHYDADGNLTTTSVTISLAKTVGSTTTALTAMPTGYAIILYDANGSAVKDINAGDTLPQTCSTVIGGSLLSSVEFCDDSSGDTLDYKTLTIVSDGKTGKQGKNGAAPRGPRVWSDIADGETLYAGVDGEEWRDLVYDDAGNPFYCADTHEKSSDKAPSYGTNTQYWTNMSSFEAVCAKMFLGQNAKIENLFVGNFQAFSNQMISLICEGLTKCGIIIDPDKGMVKLIAGQTAFYHPDNLDTPGFVVQPESNGDVRLDVYKNGVLMYNLGTTGMSKIINEAIAATFTQVGIYAGAGLSAYDASSLMTLKDDEDYLYKFSAGRTGSVVDPDGAEYDGKYYTENEISSSNIPANPGSEVTSALFVSVKDTATQHQFNSSTKGWITYTKHSYKFSFYGLVDSVLNIGGSAYVEQLENYSDLDDTVQGYDGEPWIEDADGNIAASIDVTPAGVVTYNY